MGKTRIKVVGEAPQEEEKTAVEKYKERKKKQRLRKEKGVRVPGLKGGERVVAVEAEPAPEPEAEKEPEVKQATKKEPKIRGKKYKAAKAKIEAGKLYELDEAVKLAKQTSFSKFEGSLEFHAVLRKEKFETELETPYSTGQVKKIEIASRETVKKIQEGKIDFDILLATPDFMPELIPFARILGPRGLMPNPKNGTLTKNPKEAAKKFSDKKIKVATEKKAPLIHIVVGKLNQPDKELVANLEAVIEAIGRKNIKKAVICSSMGPGIKVNTETIQSAKKQSLTKSASHKFA